MKTVKTLLSAALISVASATAIAATPALSVDNTFPGTVTAKVRMDGKPAKDATVSLYSSGGTYKREMMTDENGRAEFNGLVNYGPITVKAEINGDESPTRSMFLHMNEN